MDDTFLVGLITAVIVINGLDLIVQLVTMYWVESDFDDDERKM